MKSINDIILEELIKTSNLIILIIFWIEFCVPCEISKNIIDEIKILFKKKIKVLKININYNQYTSEKFSIRSAPTIIMLKNNEVVFKKNGIIEKNYIKKIIKKII